jgi:hypothetical protein
MFHETTMGNRSWRCRQPEPVGWLVTDSADLAAQDCVLVPEYRQLSVFGQLLPCQHRQAAFEQLGKPQEHSALIPGKLSG